jgi:hypothetical protein
VRSQQLGVEDRQSSDVASCHSRNEKIDTHKSILILISSSRARIGAMGPKLLGGGASLLAAMFILALPSIFKGEPADEVEPIEFGPSPVTKLSGAIRVTKPPPAPAEPLHAMPIPAAVAAAEGPASSPGGVAGEGATAPEPGTFAQSPGGGGASGGEGTGGANSGGAGDDAEGVPNQVGSAPLDDSEGEDDDGLANDDGEGEEDDDDEGEEDD